MFEVVRVDGLSDGLRGCVDQCERKKTAVRSGGNGTDQGYFVGFRFFDRRGGGFLGRGFRVSRVLSLCQIKGGALLSNVNK